MTSSLPSIKTSARSPKSSACSISSSTPPKTISIQVQSRDRPPEDPEITALRAEIDALKTKLTLYRQRETLQFQQAVLARRDTIEHIIQAVCAEFSIPETILFRKARAREIVEPRQIVMALAYELTDLTFAQIGRIFRMDHGTIVHSRDTVADRSTIDPIFAARLAKIRALLNANSCNSCL